MHRYARRTSVPLLVFAFALIAGPGLARESMPDHTLDRHLENAALRERISALEARLAALEVAPVETEVQPGDHTLLSRLAVVEGRLARLEQMLATADTPSRLASLDANGIGPAAAFPAVSSPTDTGGGAGSSAGPSAGLEPPPSAMSIHSADLFLPSRGSAGGALHYGTGSDRRIDLPAFLDLEYIDTENDGSRNGVSTFDNHHANVFIRSKLRDNLLGHIEIEYEHSGDVVEIDQAFLSWTVREAFTLDAGRFYTPFGIERFVWYSPTNNLVSRPLVMRQIVPNNFYANGLRASGLVNTRGSDRFMYEVSISDGLDGDALDNRRGSRQTRDNNSSRALSGRLAYSFWPRFEVGTSLHTQRYADQANLDLTFFGLDFAARFAGFEIRAEYVDATIERGNGFRSDLEQDGWYAEIAYAFQWDRLFVPELELVGRYDGLDLDAATIGNDDIDSFTFGLNALIYDHFRIKGEYQFVDEDGPNQENDAFRLQFVLDY